MNKPCKHCIHSIGEFNPITKTCMLLCERLSEFVETDDTCDEWEKSTGSEE